MLKRCNIFALSVLSFACVTSAYSATAIDLKHQSMSVISSFASGQSTLKQIKSNVDFNKTTHVRLQQTYASYPVWGADVIAHVPHGSNFSLSKSSSSTTLNGTVYQGLDADLANTPAYVFSKAQANKALEQAISTYQKKSGSKHEVAATKTNLMVYIDNDKKAHWAFLISFEVNPLHAMPEKPTFIMDAVNFTVYQNWDNIQTVSDSKGGGFGGNEKMGELIYDGLGKDLPALYISRDDDNAMCYLQNAEVTVKDRRNNDAVSQFKCDTTDDTHNNEFWDADFDAVNGAYSPSNDALFIGKVVKDMYEKWYNLPVLVDEDGKPMMLNMRVHEYMDNAYWDGHQMTFGDGITMFYPLVSFGVGAHEVSHGFTQQHSGLQYYGQSGGLNESFSDMAAQAAEYYAYSYDSNWHNNWQIGPEIFKQKDKALRYMDDPTKDCGDREPGHHCSIGNVKDYKKSLDVHYSSGIFNRVFYLIATAEGWDTRKAFDVMVQANMNYWTPTSSFEDAACGVMKATQDYKYDMQAVTNAMSAVGIDTQNCS